MMDAKKQPAGKGATTAPDDVVSKVPEDAFKAIEDDSEKAGGAWTPGPGYEGSIGRTMFDTNTSEDGTLTILLPKANIDKLPSQALVRINSLADGRAYLGAVVEGPFAEPDGLRADATPMVVNAVQGGLLMPPYHGRAQVEIIGERLESGTIIPPRRRPKPNSPVFALDAKETAAVLQIRGEFRLGLADGFEDLAVCIPANEKSVFPRHLGVLGTTGGGKSTTVSGLVAKAQKQKMAIILIDTEGEYCAISDPTEDPKMKEALARRNLRPEGVADTHIYHPAGRETRNPKHPSVTPFSLRFSALSPHAVQEILELNDAQADRFIKAYDITKIALERLKIWPRNEAERAMLLELDEFETGYPGMTLQHLYDIVNAIGLLTEDSDAEPAMETPAFDGDRGMIKGLILGAKLPKHVQSWRAVQGRLGRLRRLKIFDSSKVPPMKFKEMLKPGRVSILDLSDTDSPQINNLVIAELLRGVQHQQEEVYGEAVAAKKDPMPTVVFIEEAHEFLSAHRIQKMQVLFQQVARIARRGRKRWLGLAFVTQFPQHLPDEVLGLINNWILHKISDAGVVNRLKKSIGGINDGLWGRLSSLASGQAVTSFTSMSRPLQVSIDPTPCRLLMVE